MLTVLDLFSGIGGISLGLERTGGFRTVAFCEIEAFPRLVLAKHWPGVPVHDDVRTLTAESLGGLRPDVICGGFPCQDISVAGKGAGLHGQRSGLWFEYARLVGELRPNWILAENVGALRTRGVDRVCSDLEAEGYAVWPLLVGAWAVGAPHKRERVWIVAHRSSYGLDGIGPLSVTGGVGARECPEEGTQPESRRAAEEPPRGCSLGASELSNSDAGRRGREGDEVQAGRDEPERAASGVGLADPNREGRGGKRGRRLQHGIWAASWDHTDGCCEWPVGEPFQSVLEGQRPGRNAGGTARHDSRRALAGATGPRWPARPGEPQHEWEPARLAQFSLGRNPDELSSRLVRLARRANREALKAYGNSVVPAVVEAIGYAILEAEKLSNA